VVVGDDYVAEGGEAFFYSLVCVLGFGFGFEGEGGVVPGS
jgi:hypothetical protein